MFRVKICGITNMNDAVLVQEAGADAIGFNFYPKSPRYIDPNLAHDISQQIDRNICRVGVFVNASVSQVQSIATLVDLDAVQLHGDETPEDVQGLDFIAVIKAFRCRAGDLSHAISFLDECRERNVNLQSVLLDAFHETEYGGTGQTIDLNLLRRNIDQLKIKHWVLAGGLNSDNVKHAIETIRPSAVDTASGVESKPGEKDRQKTFTFTKNAIKAFQFVN